MEIPRYWKKRLADIAKLFAEGSKAIIVAPEHHGTRYLDATNMEALAASSLMLATDRQEQGFYEGWTEPAIPDIPRNASESDSSIIRELAVRVWSSYDHELAEARDWIDRMEKMNKAIETKDGLACFMMLQEWDLRENRPRLEWLESA